MINRCQQWCMRKNMETKTKFVLKFKNIKAKKKKMTWTYPHIIFIPFSWSRSINFIFMHNPSNLLTLWGLSSHEIKGLFESNHNPLLFYLDVSSIGLPISITGTSIWSASILILSIPWSEKIPYFFTIIYVLFYQSKNITFKVQT